MISGIDIQKTLRSQTVFCVFAVVLFYAGNRSVLAQTPGVKTAEDKLHTEAERGPVKVEVSITPSEPRLSDEPTLTLTVTAADGVRVEMPPFGESLGGFLIRDFYEPLPKSLDGNQILQQVYTLEPTFAGSISIAPIAIRFFDERADGDGQQHEVQTEGLLMEVATMIASDAPSLADLRPADDPVELPQAVSTFTVALAAIAIIAAIGVALLIWRLKRAKQASDPPLTPQQLAWRELNDLLGTKLSETDVKEFFVQLTAVVRRYIERTTGVHAPEQTTEEFLREANQQKLFADADNRRLEAFLESADLVKFAGYQPDSESIKQSTHRAKQFIELKATTEADASILTEVSS